LHGFNILALFVGFFSAVVINEFEGETFTCQVTPGTASSGTTGCKDTGDEVIDSLSFQDDSVVRSAVILCAFIVVFQFFAYVALRRNKPRYINPKPTGHSHIVTMPEDKPIAVEDLNGNGHETTTTSPPPRIDEGEEREIAHV